MPAKDDMPSMVKRSPKKAQDTYVKTHDHAEEEYGQGERAHRTALAALKHSFEKSGDHWSRRRRRAQATPRPPVVAHQGEDRRRGWTRTPASST